MKTKTYSSRTVWLAVLLIAVVAAADFLMSLLSIGLGLSDGTIPDVPDAATVENLLWARYAIAPVVAPLGAVALIWRRRFPRTVAAIAALLGALSLSGFAFMVALYLLAKRRLDWAVGLVIVLAVGAETVLSPVPMDWETALFAAVLLGAIAACGAAVGQRGRLRQAQLDSLRRRAEQAEAKQEADAQRSRLEERHRIAREMHDTLAHRMSLVAVQAAALQVDAPDDETADAARLMRENAHAALGELREVLGVLHEDGTTGQGSITHWQTVPKSGSSTDTVVAPQGVAQIDDLLAQWRQAGVDSVYAGSGELSRELPDAISRAAYRVVQEGMTNVARHAPHSHAAVSLETTQGTLTVTVSNGASAPGQAAPGAGLGLIGLEERVQLLGGELSYGPANGGFKLKAAIPFPEKSQTA